MPHPHIAVVAVRWTPPAASAAQPERMASAVELALGAGATALRARLVRLAAAPADRTDVAVWHDVDQDGVTEALCAPLTAALAPFLDSDPVEHAEAVQAATTAVLAALTARPRA